MRFRAKILVSKFRDFLGKFSQKTQILKNSKNQFLPKNTERLLNNMLLLSMNLNKIVCLRFEMV